MEISAHVNSLAGLHNQRRVEKWNDVSCWQILQKSNFVKCNLSELIKFFWKKKMRNRFEFFLAGARVWLITTRFFIIIRREIPVFVWRCFTRLDNASRRFTTLHDASRRFTMLHDDWRRFTMSPGDVYCHSNCSRIWTRRLLAPIASLAYSYLSTTNYQRFIVIKFFQFQICSPTFS